MPYILLWLEGPLQSWGADSKSWQRNTEKFPTKSAITGIILSAMGLGGEQQELLATLAPLDLVVTAYSKSITIPPELKDFHMIGSGFNSDDKWENLQIPKNAIGKKVNGSGSKLSYRYYCQDMAYAVAFQLPENLIESASKYLQSPIWPIYLGRKCCVPSDVVFRGVFPIVEEALKAADTVATNKSKNKIFTVKQGDLSETLEEDDIADIFSIMDVPISFGLNKKYRERTVTIIYEKLHND
ncbi:MAG: type I-E CRISPR-associated protein Cas5/CasD [Ruminobacter sp.]|nr:type I-E CRISPR-associated protein Cas5/CasD [Ruminobacter sp.]